MPLAGGEVQHIEVADHAWVLPTELERYAAARRPRGHEILAQGGVLPR
ncbi:MAG: hypothetical protein IPH72_30700 [Sandaracinaceae bacterium]|nr:hypothetical protein [Sandaracinaceae bacterium]